MNDKNRVIIKALDRRDFPSHDSVLKATYKDGRYIATVSTEKEFDEVLSGQFVEQTVLVFFNYLRVQLSSAQARRQLRQKE